ncbi:MAG: hypothetical protein ACK44L_08570, partial [Burkholderiales bacterium]
GCGVDIEPAGVARTAELLERAGLAGRSDVVQGSRWAPCRRQRVDLGLTRSRVAAQGLVTDLVHTASALIPAAKLASMSPDVLKRFEGQFIYRMGEYTFGDFHIIEIRRPEHA